LSIYGNKFTGLKQPSSFACLPERSGSEPSIEKFFPAAGRAVLSLVTKPRSKPQRRL